ncbi:MAG: hypothetical protein MUC98_12635 [Desulfobacterota bacterium]|nr:hypothetical protein [Thermodesulfobacteriota bacterium]
MAELKQILEELAKIAGPDRLKTDPGVTAQFAVDGLVPKAVVFPKDTRMVAALVQCACRVNLAMVPWGSGTKMAGEAGQRWPWEIPPSAWTWWCAWPA